MSKELEKKKKEIMEELIIGTKSSLKIQIRSLKSQVAFLKNRRNIRNCDYQFVCNGKQKKGSVICDDCFEHIRKKALKDILCKQFHNLCDTECILFEKGCGLKEIKECGVE